MIDTTDAQKIRVLLDEVDRLRDINQRLEEENALLSRGTPAQRNALALLRLQPPGVGMAYRGSAVFPATWDNLARRGLVSIDWTVLGARPDGIVTLAAEQTR